MIRTWRATATTPGHWSYSLLVSPGGEVVWRHAGAVDGEALRATVLDYMGTFYKP